MALHKLPNGAWLDLRKVVAIRILPESSPNLDERVAVHWGDGFIELCTPPYPIQFAEELAGLVNQELKP